MNGRRFMSETHDRIIVDGDMGVYLRPQPDLEVSLTKEGFRARRRNLPRTAQEAVWRLKDGAGSVDVNAARASTPPQFSRWRALLVIGRPTELQRLAYRLRLLSCALQRRRETSTATCLTSPARPPSVTFRTIDIGGDSGAAPICWARCRI